MRSKRFFIAVAAVFVVFCIAGCSMPDVPDASSAPGCYSAAAEGIHAVELATASQPVLVSTTSGDQISVAIHRAARNSVESRTLVVLCRFLSRKHQKAIQQSQTNPFGSVFPKTRSSHSRSKRKMRLQKSQKCEWKMKSDSLLRMQMCTSRTCQPESPLPSV